VRVPVSASDRVPVLAWVIAAVFVGAELAVSGRYGFLQDELYFIVAGHHLAFGYADQPPLGPLLTRVTGFPGVSPAAIRIIPALAGGAIVVMTARLAALLGAVRRGPVRPGAGRLHHGVRPGPAGRGAYRQHHAAGPARLDGCPGTSARRCCGSGRAGGSPGEPRPVPGSRLAIWSCCC
jgi:hypothetical protein